jgi:hypothetical protein
MTEICPHCNTQIDAILNPEGIVGATINICSSCRSLLVIKDTKIRKITFSEAYRHYEHLKALAVIERTDELIFKLAWVKRALVKMQQEKAVLN